jgi:acyl transferase domain-containing protein
MEDARHYLKLSGRVGNHNTSVRMRPVSQETSSNSTGIFQPKILVFSSQDERGIERLAAAYNDHFSGGSHSGVDENCLARLAYTLSDRRSSLLWRSFEICNTTDSLRKGIKLSRPVRALSAARLALCFTGQGAQWFAMGRELEMFEVYSRSIAQSSAVLRALGCPWSLSGMTFKLLPILANCECR